MNLKKKFLLRAVMAPVMVTLLLGLAPADSPQLRYVGKYAQIAVREMYRSGVPASITLAQGMLESRYGMSELASVGNNHFGIKCHDWKGKRQYADDDRKSECFRVYDCAEDSFRDHSDFLRYRDRYKSLFDNQTTDYKSWAYGLKEAGYATDPAYPQKLIRLIEDYGLSRYDRMRPEDFSGQSELSDGKEGPEGSQASSGKSGDRRVRKSVSSGKSGGKRVRAAAADARKREKRLRKGASSGLSHDDCTDDVPEEIPESPLTLEQPEKIRSANETHSFSLSRQKYSMNGVPFIYAQKGETLASIAASNSLFVRELMRFNDMKEGQEPQPGDIVYLQAKKKVSAKGVDKYIADSDGETLRYVSQRFAVRLSDLCKRNSLPQDYVLREGDTILLR